ncbi:amidohydrolase family protein [Brachyspira pilosicoli WesB]|uniref:Amidohydrolase family protein n=1 Tax=Brachyspira pilosicoli WesB TaxID=1161918 RepID=K0JKL4_BRAPL|nr:amidohydrolase family protein [Brachyspira pilosicoli]CCG56736.1 amidohydrolase family protein [Brachyspira pilosicoli WesB]
MIIDFHSHIKRNIKENRFEIEELLEDMKKNHVDKRCVSAIDGPSIREQNEYVKNIVLEHDNLFAFAVINPKEENSIKELEYIIDSNIFYGIEFNGFYHGYNPESCEFLDDIFNMISKTKLIVKIFTGICANGVPQQWTRWIKQYNNIKFVMLHMGCFDYGYSCVDLAMDYKNVYLETSNQYEVQIFNKAFQNIEAERILFGSQYPNKFTKNSISLFDYFNLDKNVLNKIFFENANKLLNEVRQEKL